MYQPDDWLALWLRRREFSNMDWKRVVFIVSLYISFSDLASV